MMQQKIIVEDRAAHRSSWHEESTGKCEKASETRAEKLERWGKNDLNKCRFFRQRKLSS